MKRLMDILHNYQSINIEEKGISFAEDGFTQLYAEALKANGQYIDELKLATGKGIIIGAVSVGLIGLGVKGFNRFRRHKLKDEEKEDAETALEEMIISKSEASELIRLLREINENNRGVIH